VEKPTYLSVAEASKQWRDDAVVDAFTIDGRRGHTRASSPSGTRS